MNRRSGGLGAHEGAGRLRWAPSVALRSLRYLRTSKVPLLMSWRPGRCMGMCMYVHVRSTPRWCAARTYVLVLGLAAPRGIPGSPPVRRGCGGHCMMRCMCTLSRQLLIHVAWQRWCEGVPRRALRRHGWRLLHCSTPLLSASLRCLVCVV